MKLTPVEKVAVNASAYKALYKPDEKIPAIVVNNFPMLGKLTALRFIEWVQANPEGVISLPTGKTPEYFIKWVNYFLKNWEKPNVRSQIEYWHIDPAVKPALKGLHFVQIDEFYPIDSRQTNSFTYYVKKYYLKAFKLDAKRALLIDPLKIGLPEGKSLSDIWPDNSVNLSLRYEEPHNHQQRIQKDMLARIDQWCVGYENSIRSLGGIGFFLGGIGPDGHIGFNIAGSDHYSTTRLCPINYETQAAAATDLGGIETARKSLVITIGLKTITQNPRCTALIMVAGEAKAQIVAQAVQSTKNINVPASALQILPNARFFITRGASKKLTRRCLVNLKAAKHLEKQQIERVVIELSEKRNKPILKLSQKDFKADSLASAVLNKSGLACNEIKRNVHDSLLEKIERGLAIRENTCFLHTEPHHDDVMLGYFASVVRNIRNTTNQHHFMTLTSGFTSVTNAFMVEQINILSNFINTSEFKKMGRNGYFKPDNFSARKRDIWQYLDGVAAENNHMKNDGCARRFARNLMEVYKKKKLSELLEVLADLSDYFANQYPGAMDPQSVKILKGMCREWESECLWGYFGFQCGNIYHLRLGFYTGDIFVKQPTHERDVVPIVRSLEKINPDVITVALDPEASGPDTHYKVLQAIAEALKIYEKKTQRTNIKVWGYRNVWFRFDPSQADTFIPVSLNMFAIKNDSFANAFLSQKSASFPSHEYDGPFSRLAQKIQVSQYQKIKTCMGREWFHKHSNALIRATRGFIFLREMDTKQFYKSCRELEKSIGDIEQ